MKHIKTFENFLNENARVNEGEDREAFIEALKGEVEKAGGYLYSDPEDSEIFAISKSSLSTSDLDTMFDSGRPAKDTFMTTVEDGLLDAEKKIADGAKKLGINVNVKRLVQIYA